MNEMKTRGWFCLACLWWCLAPVALGEATREQVEHLLDSNVHDWRWRLGESPEAEQPGFDDSQWERVDVGFRWWPHDSVGWFRTRITIPETINGISVKGGLI